MIELSMVYDKIQTENGFSKLSTVERQEIQMKKAKLIGMLDEVFEIEYGYCAEYHLGQLKAKIAKLRTQLLEPPKGWYHGGHDEDNMYELLGVSETNSFDKIKATFRKLAKETHQDLVEPMNDSTASRQFVQILATYEVIDLIRDKNLQMLSNPCLEGELTNDDGTELVCLPS
ncbi:Developmentally-regulated G-protein 1 [Glycine max]|nr:Developmentally-regulated G-protein 1 [Glycine max]